MATWSVSQRGVLGDRTWTGDVVLAGVSLLEAARAEVDQIEAALLFAARAAGITWADVATALGLGSAQAAQQRLERVVTRTEGTERS